MTPVYSYLFQGQSLLFWIELSTIFVYLAAYFFARRKLGSFFTMHFLVTALFWAVGQSLLFRKLRLETSPFTLFHKVGVSYLPYLLVVIFWLLSLVIAEKVSKKVIYDEKWNWRLIFVFLLSFFLLNTPLEYFMLKFKFIDVVLVGQREIVFFWPFVKAIFLSIEGLVFLWILKKIRQHGIKRGQGLFYCSFLAIFSLPLLWIIGIIIIGLGKNILNCIL